MKTGKKLRWKVVYRKLTRAARRALSNDLKWSYQQSLTNSWESSHARCADLETGNKHREALTERCIGRTQVKG